MLFLGSDFGFPLFFVMVFYWPPAILCLLYSAFVLPLFDYCDVVWCPTTAKLTSMIERVHSNFVKKLPLSFRSKFSFSMTERHMQVSHSCSDF